MFHVDTAVQTDAYIDKLPVIYAQPLSPDVHMTDEVEGMSSLASSDLILIIRQSKEIADCLSLSSGSFPCHLVIHNSFFSSFTTAHRDCRGFVWSVHAPVIH